MMTANPEPKLDNFLFIFLASNSFSPACGKKEKIRC